MGQNLSLKIPLDCLSIFKLLEGKLLEVVLRKQKETRQNAPAKIPLYRLKSPIGYRCAIALQLTQGLTFSPQAIAEELIIYLMADKARIGDRACLEFTLRVWESGWIDFYLSDRALAIWLQQLPQSIYLSQEQQVKQDIFATLFAPQYAHARCCSLLRLGHREQLIELRDPDFQQPVWQWKHPYPIPWHKGSNFQLTHRTEQHLIGQFLAVTDKLPSKEIENSIKLAMNLSEAVLEFERYCRIWGEVKQETPDLSQARLALIAIAQLLLWQLLQEKIGVWAPIEL